MFPYFIENNLISENQSEIKSGYSCVNQLLAINLWIYFIFDYNYEASRVFLDISKAFNELWHEGIIHTTEWNLRKYIKLFNRLLKKYTKESYS